MAPLDFQDQRLTRFGLGHPTSKRCRCLDFPSLDFEHDVTDFKASLEGRSILVHYRQAAASRIIRAHIQKTEKRVLPALARNAVIIGGRDA